MIVKRIFDLACVVFSLVVVFPILLAASVWIKLDTSGPVFFRQERIGRGGKPFKIYKLRTMTTNQSAGGMKITVGEDRRITSSGRFLRKYKIDELAQIINILKGEMSLVGPRPEVAKYTDQYPSDVRKIVLSVPPGLTDFASIEFRNENMLLAGHSNPEDFYLSDILPRKLELYVKYVTERSLLTDIRLLALTMLVLTKNRS